MAETVPTVPNKSGKAAKAGDEAATSAPAATPATDPPTDPPTVTEANTAATGSARSAFDELAGTDQDADQENDRDDDGEEDPPVVTATNSPVARVNAVAQGIDPAKVDDAEAEADPDVPDDAPVPASRRVSKDETDGLSAGSALMRATSAAGSVTCPKCGAVWPLQNRFAGGVIPCVCGRNIEVGSPK